MRRWILLAGLLLAGCQSQAEEALTVDLQASAEQVQVWEPVTFTIGVETFGEPEQDALVEMELINEAGHTVGIVNANLVEPGKYALETVLDVAGTYEIISHVTVDEHHSMPAIELTVVE